MCHNEVPLELYLEKPEAASVAVPFFFSFKLRSP